MIPTQHQKAGNYVRKDQSRRLRYQEAQKLKQQAVKDSEINRRAWEGPVELSKGQIKTFTSKLVK